MIVGVGIDVVDIARFAETLERTPALADRVFTPDERQRTVASQAARFAAKEALAKALGAPAGLHWHDAEVVRDDAGRPWFSVRGTVQRRCVQLGVQRVHLSLSHDAGVASAMVVLEGDGSGTPAGPATVVPATVSPATVEPSSVEPSSVGDHLEGEATT
nr:holo-ACP synthase [Phytoactinopolyspora limicola]